MTQYIKKLPDIFQTTTEKKFFDATFDQVFSKKDSDLIRGYIGRRTPSLYDPINDFYLPEPNKDRTWWQLEATAFARDPDTSKTNIFFYDDLLNRINYYGGNTLNQDRLFESSYYSWAPPIDVDMFTNYYNYYWVDQGLVTISISGVLYTDIVPAGSTGLASYTTPSTAVPANVTLSTGMRILLVDDDLHPNPYVVENVGHREYASGVNTNSGIRLVQESSDYTNGTVFEFLPWDGYIQLLNNRSIRNANWDILAWDIQVQPGSADYITIERGSFDNNAWSRTNKWVHIDTIKQTASITGTPFPSNASRALRPIIQFSADLLLYKSGTQFRSEVQFGLYNNTFGSPLLYSDYQGMLAVDVNAELSIYLTKGDLVCFLGDTASYASGKINQYVFKTDILLDGTINFVPYSEWMTPAVEGDIVFVTKDGPYDSAQRGQTWYYSNNAWQEAYNDKNKVNQPPLFQLFDHNHIPLDDKIAYPNSTFKGSKIFSYKEDTTPGVSVDPVLKFPIVYTSLGQASDIIFQNNLITDRYTYSQKLLPINGYYYFIFTDTDILQSDWNLYSPCVVAPA